MAGRSISSWGDSGTRNATSSHPDSRERITSKTGSPARFLEPMMLTSGVMTREYRRNLTQLQWRTGTPESSLISSWSPNLWRRSYSGRRRKGGRISALTLPFQGRNCEPLSISAEVQTLSSRQGRIPCEIVAGHKLKSAGHRTTVSIVGDWLTIMYHTWTSLRLRTIPAELTRSRGRTLHSGRALLVPGPVEHSEKSLFYAVLRGHSSAELVTGKGVYVVQVTCTQHTTLSEIWTSGNPSISLKFLYLIQTCLFYSILFYSLNQLVLSYYMVKIMYFVNILN